MSDLEAKCFIKKGNALIPADFAADEFMDGIANGKEILVSIRRPRSPQHHRWFFALLRKVVENTDGKWGDEEDLLDDLKLATGHRARRANLLTGEIYEVAKSINFASMKEDKFRRFKDRCLFIMSKALGIDPVTLMQEVDATQKPISKPSPSIAPRSPVKERETAV